MLISSLAFPDFMDTTERMHAKGPTLIQDLVPLKSLFQEVKISPNTGNQRIIDEYDGEMYARTKIESGNARRVSATKGWSKTITMKRIASEVVISWELRNLGKDQEIIRRITSLSHFCPQRFALDLTHVFTFSNATSYTDMDGETIDLTMGYTTDTALVDSTHDLTGSTDTYSTVITGTPYFSKGAFQIARERAKTQTKDNYGKIVLKNFNTVVTGNDPVTLDEVDILKKSPTDPSQINPGVINSYSGSFMHVILPRLATTATGAYDSTKEKWWFYIAANEWLGYYGIWEQANMTTPDIDSHNDDWSVGTRMSYGIGVVTGSGFLASCS